MSFIKIENIKLYELLEFFNDSKLKKYDLQYLLRRNKSLRAWPH